MNWTIHWLTTAFDGLVAFLPNLIAGIVILILGYIVALILRRVTRALAHRLGFDRLTERLGVASATEPHKGSRVLGSAVFAIVMLVAIMQASRAWNLGFVALGIAAFIAYVPHIIAAVVVFGAALYVGNFVRDRLFRRQAENGGEIEQIRMLPSLVRGAILAVGAFMALRELQIAPEIVNAAFVLTLGAMAVASAIAFGFGGRDIAARIMQSWYDRRRVSGVVREPVVHPSTL
ncbi:MAG: hypothetical protein KF819_11270 [Labilithrix sp.]|nr:hypothetical protein [Labilithrix sp.]